MVDQRARSPRIESVSWGHLEVEGESGSFKFKDAKLFPGGSRGWDWTETGTDHEPGVQPADTEELLERGATTIVFGRGFHERLQVREETLRRLRERNVEAYLLQTEEAVRLYNELSKKDRVGALIHSTC